MSHALESFRRAVEQVSSQPDTKFVESKLAGIFSKALQEALDEETASALTQESSQILPLQRVLEIIIPRTDKLPDYVVDLVFFDLVATSNLDAVATCLRLLAVHRYPLLEQIALKVEILFQLRGVFDQILVYPGNA